MVLRREREDGRPSSGCPICKDGCKLVMLPGDYIGCSQSRIPLITTPPPSSEGKAIPNLKIKEKAHPPC